VSGDCATIRWMPCSCHGVPKNSVSLVTKLHARRRHPIPAG
jgi:hypothetical protein